MDHTTIISTDELERHLHDANWVIVDCRFELTEPEAGFERYRESHIPGAVYANLDHDLAGPITPESGRHPLPDVDVFKQTLGLWGIDASKQVVVYDDWFGALAARLWWMLRVLGHNAVAVLDGGIPKWQQEAKPLVSGIHQNEAVSFRGDPLVNWTVSLEEVEQISVGSNEKLIDSRDPSRFRGEEEPLDRVAGHIPGAINHYFEKNLDAEGFLLPPEQLRQQFESLLDKTRPDQAVFYCGSGVSACQNLLAMEHAGLWGAKLYVGSWSQWCKDPARPVETSLEFP